MGLIDSLRDDGLRKTFGKGLLRAWQASGMMEAYYRRKFAGADVYHNPSEPELASIERALAEHGVAVQDLVIDPRAFTEFKKKIAFPANYHGGAAGGVWDEKILEHFIAYELARLDDLGPDDVYVDVAACASPWARLLREQRRLQAYAIDLTVASPFRGLPYYHAENATRTSFADASVLAMSLQCAYEMFEGDDDVGLLREAARILSAGGRLVISPLYMHTHYCSYSTPDYWGTGRSDPLAKEYLRLDFLGVPSSRKYDAGKLRERVLDPLERFGLAYNLHALRNKAELGAGIYCHFVLEVRKP